MAKTMKTKRKYRKRKTKRICLRCDREFWSEGNFNRICPSCREINANIMVQSLDFSIESYRDSAS